ncbi:tyrosine-type recombinase/integrase [Alkalihalobacillus sp. NPDC078783]
MAIKQLDNGKFKVDVSLGEDPVTGNRRRKIRVFDSRKEAEAYEDELYHVYNTKQIFGERKLSFEFVKNIYLEDRKVHTKQNTSSMTQYVVEKHITPYFIDSNLRSLTVGDIRKFQLKLIESGMANKTINNIMVILKGIFKQALEENAMSFNPADNVSSLKKQTKQMKFWTPEQFKLFLSLIKEEDFLFKAFYSTAFLTGMRCGEMLALNWNDIDTYRREINVYKALSYNRSQLVISEPKTRSSIRRISINNKLLLLLDEWKQKQIELFRLLGMSHSNETHVFQYKDVPPTKDIFSRRIRTICKGSDLEPIRLHDLRHSHVALLIHQKEDYATIKERLGHASIKTTIDVYGHLYPNKQQETADKLDDFL